LYAEGDLSARGYVETIGVAGGVIKVVALTGGAGTFLVVTVDEPVAIVIDAVGANFDRLGLKKH
jgi:hypothetical protein